MSTDALYELYIASRKSAALAAAVRAGLFDWLDRGPATPEAIASALDLAPRGVRILCRALEALGLLAREGDRLSLSSSARAHLVRGRSGWLGGLIDLEIESFLSPALVLEALRRPGPSVYGGEDPWERHARDPERAEAFTRAMHSISEQPAQALARSVDLGDAREVIDVGGGSGVISIALARAWPRLRCVVWDLPQVCEQAQRYLSASGLGGRVTLAAGDLFGSPVPGEPDVALLSQILHDWPPETCRALLTKLFRALPAGGRILVHEKLIGPGEPLANALVDLDLLVWTEGQQWDERGLFELLRGVGFEHVERQRTGTYWSLVTGRKPER
ncbi:MAG: methyltransferase [Myxococcota bacterium]